MSEEAQGKKFEDIKNPYTLEYKAGKSLTSKDSKASKILLCQSLKTKSRAKKFVAPHKSSEGGVLRKTYMLDYGVDDVHPLARAKGGGVSQNTNLHSQRIKRGNINIFIAYKKHGSRYKKNYTSQ